MKKRIKSLLTVLCLSAVLLNIIPVYAGATDAAATTAPTAAATDAMATDAAATDAAATVAPTEAAGFSGTYSGEYHAYMGIQTNTMLWIFRNAFDDPKLGFGSENFKGLSSIKGTDSTFYDGTFTDAVIDGDGTYTVTLENPDFATEERLSLLFVSTDIPLSDSVTITDVTAKFDGSTKSGPADATISKDSKVYFNFQLLSDWNPDLKDAFFYPWPFKKAEITFTIKGLGYESAAQAVTPTPVPTVAPTKAAAADSSAADDSVAASTDSADSEGGLSTPLIIGIVAGAVVILGAVAFLALKKKKK